MSVLEQIRPSAAFPKTGSAGSALGRQAITVVVASLLVAVSAHVSVPLPFTPVPLTLQTFAVVLIGLLAGPAVAFSALLLYLAEGACGAPVFSPAGPGGLLQLLGPTAGYLFSYPLAAALASALYRRGSVERSNVGLWFRGLLASSAAVVLMLSAGTAWFATVLHLPFSAAITGAVLPFVPGELVKICAATGIAAAVRRRA